MALARALASGPKLLLLDEPFGALDAVVRKTLRAGLKEIVRSVGVTTVSVGWARCEQRDSETGGADGVCGGVQQVVAGSTPTHAGSAAGGGPQRRGACVLRFLLLPALIVLLLATACCACYNQIIVTHDQEEAFDLADKVVIFNRGIIEQVGVGVPGRHSWCVVVRHHSRPRECSKGTSGRVPTPHARGHFLLLTQPLRLHTPYSPHAVPRNTPALYTHTPILPAVWHAHRDHQAPRHTLCHELCRRHQQRAGQLPARAPQRVQERRRPRARDVPTLRHPAVH